ncbi:solute carrier family 35 (GDP-fucose transporter), member C1, partial [Phenoliferia sp. Uapishka_3]
MSSQAQYSRLPANEDAIEMKEPNTRPAPKVEEPASRAMVVFSQIARGLVLPFTVFFSWFLLRSHSSYQTLLAVGIVCFGFLLGVGSERISASGVGVALGVASSVTTSIHAIVVKHSLPIVNGNTLDLVYYQNLLSAMVILPFVLLSGEAYVVWDMAVGVGSSAGALGTFLTGAAVTGVFGFLICIAGFLSIKVTSPVSHMISAAVRGVLQTFLGIWVFGDVVKAGRGFGIVAILAGSIFYVYTKSQEQQAAKSLPTQAPPADINRARSPGPSGGPSYAPVDEEDKEAKARVF